MAYIDLPDSVPGIRGPLNTFPETGVPLSAFTQQLMRGASSLTPAERELIAAAVSQANGCDFCARSHAATARQLFPEQDTYTVNRVVYKGETGDLSEKMKALLDVALAVRENGKRVSQVQIDRARAAGADDKAIHDTVLIAAAFCMFNRYVDGLATWTPDDEEIYNAIGERLSTAGYSQRLAAG